MDDLRRSVLVRWAMGENAHRRTPYGPDPNSPGFSIILTNCAQLLLKAENGLEPSFLWDQPTGHNERIEGAISHWKSGNYMDLPVAFVNEHGALRIADGRHRLLVALYLGHETAPVAVPVDKVDAYKAYFS
jgi:hypothetical protein